MIQYQIIQNSYGRWDAYEVRSNQIVKVDRAQNHTLVTVMSVLMRRSKDFEVKVIQNKETSK